MKSIQAFIRFSVLASLFLSVLSSATVLAEDPDFSCIEESVLAKTMVTQRYKEFDVILKNDCPGPVNWTMCIEKMDPFTHRVTETLTPSGNIDPDKKFRINMQMKKQEDERNKLTGYEEFYVNVVYDIDKALAPSCVAKTCESQKRPVREQIRSNQRAWQKAQSSIDRKIASECPRSGWSDAQQEKCQTRIEKESQATIQTFRSTDQELKTELAAIDPELCEAH